MRGAVCQAQKRILHDYSTVPNRYSYLVHKVGFRPSVSSRGKRGGMVGTSNVKLPSRLRGKDGMAQDVRLNLEEQTRDAVFGGLPSRRIDDGVCVGTGGAFGNAAACWFDRSTNVCCIGGRERARVHVRRIANVELERRRER